MRTTHLPRFWIIAAGFIALVTLSVYLTTAFIAKAAAPDETKLDVPA